MTIARTLHPLKGERDFEWRGGNPTRVEALTDMVFAFALTLLVVSSTPPQAFSQLIDQLWGFPGFVAAFGILLMLWHAHYIYFRRYGLQDGVTTALNAGLLFLVLFFVYPLKYLAIQFSTFLRSVAEGAPSPPMTLDEAQSALVILAAGYVAVFLMLAALYMRALSKAEQLDLTPRERQLTRLGCAQQGIQAFVGVSVLLGALLIPMPWSPFAGFLFFLIGPLTFIAGVTLAPDPKPAPRPSM